MLYCVYDNVLCIYTLDTLAHTCTIYKLYKADGDEMTDFASLGS